MSNSIDYSLISELRSEVTVICVTFNHAKFIEICLDSILQQQTTFDFKVVIHDDASTDGTQEILAKYAEKYSDRILLIQQRENQYSKGNKPWWNIIPRIQSKFYAMCEGDDFWTSTTKLQRQYEAMSADSNCTICFHNLELRNELNETTSLFNKEKEPAIFELNDLLKGVNFIGTASVMYRNDFLTIPSYFFKVPYGDYTLHLHHASKGSIRYIPEVMGVYRISSSGSHSSLFNTKKGKLLALEKRALLWKIHSESDVSFSIQAKDNYKRRLSELMEGAIGMGNSAIFLKYFDDALRLGIYSGKGVFFKKLLRIGWNRWMK